MNTGPAIVVIPSRLGSLRLPRKALADIGGRPMIARVVERCSRARGLEAVVVATDDEEIGAEARAAGARVSMTPAELPSGTDRVAAAAERLGLPDDARIINVQGDQPFVDPALIEAFAQALGAPGIERVTARAPLAEGAEDPARVKVVTDPAGRALYFSRAPIPHAGPWWLHIGIYGFRLGALRDFAALPPTPLEAGERLEQLRLLEHGRPLFVLDWPDGQLSVDTEADLQRARAALLDASSEARPPSPPAGAPLLPPSPRASP